MAPGEQTLGCATEYKILVLEEIVNLDQTTGASEYGRPIGELQFSTLSWDRRLDDTSEAVVTIPTNTDCCTSGFLADLHVWHHGIAIYRNGELVWDGPIVLMAFSRDEIVITARDVSALLSKRLLPRPLCFSNDPLVCVAGTDGVVFGPRSPEFVAATLIQEGLTYDSHGAFVTLLSESADVFEASYLKYGGPVFDLLQKLASNFVNWTVLGRRIVVSQGGLLTGQGLARTATLMCADFTADAFTVTEDGLATFTQDVQIADSGNIGIYSAFLNTQVAEAYYGLLQGVQDGNRAISVRGDLSEADALALGAKAVVQGGYPPPLVLAADGLQLSPNAPVTMAELVPGTIVPVLVDCLCRPVGQLFILGSVKVTVDENGERVEPVLQTLGSDNPGTSEEGYI